MSEHIRGDFNHGAAVDWNAKEVVKDSLYDWQQYGAAGQVQLSFFQEEVNTGASLFGAGKKTYEDTNMESSAQMSRGEAFLVHAIALRFVSGVSLVQDDITAAAPAALNFPANDEAEFWNKGWLEFKVLNKVQTRLGPMSNFPPPQQLRLEASMSAFYTQAAAADGTIQLAGAHAVPVGQIFVPQEPGITLEYGMKFSLTLNWSAALAMPSGQAGLVQANLLGVRMRVGQ